MFFFFKNKSFLKRFLISYFILLSIPFSTIIFTQITASKTIQDNIMESSKNTLIQFFNLMDNTLFGIKSEALQMLQSDLVKQHAVNIKKSGAVNNYDIYSISKYLKEYNTSDYTFTSPTERFIYFYNSDMIVSSEYSSLSSNFYYQAYYLNSKKYEDFYNKISQKTNYHVALVSLNNRKPYGDLAITVSGNSSDIFSPPDISSAVIIEQNSVGKILNSFGNQQGIFIIFDENNNSVASSSSEGEAINLSGYNGRDSLYYETFNGKKYTISVYQSKVCQATYVYALPTSVFWKKLYALNLICLFSIMLCVVTSAVLSVVLAKRSYQPIGSLISTISNKTPFLYDRNMKNEMDFVTDVLNSSIAQNKILNDRIQNQHNTLKEEFLIRALQGTLYKNKEGAASEQFGYKESDLFCVILIKIEQVDEEATGSISYLEGQGNVVFIITDVMEELCCEKYIGKVVSLTQTTLAALIGFPDLKKSDEYAADVKAICTKLQNFIKEHFSMISTLSISEISSGLPFVHDAYIQANDALEYRYLYGKGCIITYGDIFSAQFQYNFSAETRCKQVLLQYIKESNPFDSIQNLYTAVQNDFFALNDASLETIDFFRFNLINIINKILLELNLSWLNRNFNFVYSLLHAETYDDFKQQVYSIITQIKASYQETRGQYTICDKTEDFIKQNYFDQSLNNNIIGQYMNISPSYLSKLFRAQKGVSLIDFLTEVRINNSKELLVKTSFSVSEIALKTGFSSSTIFIKTFKRNEGITPGEYRNLNS